MKIKMHAMYDHFPDYNPLPGEQYIDCYSDTYVKECNHRGNNIALMLEPRSMIGDAYQYVLGHADYFKYIFTHDSELLKLPQARELNWGQVWLTTDSEKIRGISLMTSYKNWCPLHNARLKLARLYEDSGKVDVFYGDWNNPKVPEVKAQDYLERYRYSIIIENDIDEFWYTEKILNCFATKTVPIYLGATKISERFNSDGIITVKDWREVPEVIDSLYREGLDTVYHDSAVQDAIEDNFKRVEPYQIGWKERFFRDYGRLLEEMLDE